MALCACGSGREYADCCQPYLDGTAAAPTAEALMRSRYTAYTMAKIPYLKETLAPEKRKEFSADQARRWAMEATWRGLRIIKTQETGATATVEFIASFSMKDQAQDHHELATFRKDEAANRWYFIDGHDPDDTGESAAAPVVTYVREQPKVGRNEPCPCGSGRKHKQCCGK
ncbi:MAG TPA: YchJ family protein [bacterium]|nr:YchJ family protein [bacterium]